MQSLTSYENDHILKLIDYFGIDQNIALGDVAEKFEVIQFDQKSLKMEDDEFEVFQDPEKYVKDTYRRELREISTKLFSQDDSEL